MGMLWLLVGIGVDIVVKVFATFMPKLALFGVYFVVFGGVMGWIVANMQLQ